MLRKTTLFLLIASCMSAFNAYALDPQPNSSFNSMGGVISAINATTAAVARNDSDIVTATNKVPQATVDILSPKLETLSAQLTKIQNTQTQSWNQFVKMQADQQFTAAGDNSSYDLLNDLLYQPLSTLNVNSPTNPQNTQDLDLTTWISSNVSQSDGTNSTRTQENLSPKIALANSNQYSHTSEDSLKNFSLSLLSPIFKENENTGAITAGVLIDVFNSRLPGSDGTPGMMQTLASTLNNLFTPEWQNDLAKASPVDVARAQTVLMALHDYMQYQQLKLQQEQLLMMAAQIAELSKLNSK